MALGPAKASIPVYDSSGIAIKYACLLTAGAPIHQIGSFLNTKAKCVQESLSICDRVDKEEP
jgi:hypothetical protein